MRTTAKIGVLARDCAAEVHYPGDSLDLARYLALLSSHLLAPADYSAIVNSCSYDVVAVAFFASTAPAATEKMQ